MRPRLAPVLLAAALLLPASATAYPDPDDAIRYGSRCLAENDRNFVHDFVGLLSDHEGVLVEEEACALYQEDGAHLVLAIVPDLDGESIDQYALHLVRKWGIGDQDRLDGLLVLYAADDGSGSGAVRVEVGYGLEGTVNSLVAREAVDSMAALKRSLMANGTPEREATAHALAAGAAGLALFTRSNLDGTAGERDSRFTAASIPLWVWLALAMVVLSVLGGGRRGRGNGFLLGLLLGGLMRKNGGGGSGGGWGGSRGGRSGGFGGGKSGGGGWNGRL